MVLLAMCLWWLIDWALILAGKIPDGNGVSLVDDM